MTSAARVLTGWGRTAPSRATVYSPSATNDVVELLRACGPRGLIARGLGRCYGDAAQNAGGCVVETRGLASTVDIDPDSGVAVVDAGVSIGELTDRLVPLGWFPPVVPGTQFVTVGGAIAADIHGKNHHVDGSFCKHVISLDLVTPDGERRTLAPDRDPASFAATAGGMGLTGVIVRATIRLARIETSWMSTDTARARDLDDLLARLEQGDAGYRYSVAWIDCQARGRHLGRGVLGRGNHATLAKLDTSARERPLARAVRARLSVPSFLPSGLIRPSTARVFNELWFRRAPREESARLEPLESFFWPLDRVLDWNRLYGPNGMLQYQLVVPFGEEETLRFAVERFSREGAAALAVLKRLGPGRGMLSFPIGGWTLAVDAPAGGANLDAMLDELDDAVANAGGRLYLAKESRMRPELVPAMYPELERWRAARNALDPDRAMQSDLARRLSLLGS